jgi:hypothetical protein
MDDVPELKYEHVCFCWVHWAGEGEYSVSGRILVVYYWQGMCVRDVIQWIEVAEVCRMGW